MVARLIGITALASASSAGMRKRTFSVMPGSVVELDLAELAQAVDQLLHQLVRAPRRRR